MTSKEIEKQRYRFSNSNSEPLWEIAYQIAVLNERADEEFRWKREQTAIDRELDANEAAAKASGNETLEQMTRVAAELSSSLGIRPHSGPPCPNCQQYLPAEPGKLFAICGSCYRAVFDDGTFKKHAAEIPKPS